MAKLRHLAINVEDPEATVKLFRDVFEMKELSRVGFATPTSSGAIYMTDGMINVAILKMADPSFPNYGKMGLNHIGFVVKDLHAAVDRAHKAGCTTQLSDQEIKPGESWEYKMTTPDGVDFDLYDVNGRGWPGIAGLEDLGIKGEITGDAHLSGKSLAGV